MTKGVKHFYMRKTQTPKRKVNEMTNTTEQRIAELKKTAVIIEHEAGVRISRSQIILGEGEEVDAMVLKALLQGKEVSYKADGRKEQIHDRLVFDSSKDGSERYTWSKDQNKVAYKRTFITTYKDGTRTEEVMKTVWKSL